MDPAELRRVLARQEAAAEALHRCARRLGEPAGWARTGEHRRAAGTLQRRLAQIADRLDGCATTASGLAALTRARSAQVAELDEEHR